MLKDMGQKLRKWRFKRAARRYLREKYGDIFTWRAALRLDGDCEVHIFSAAAKDMSVVCELEYLETHDGRLTEEQGADITEAAFCLSVFPAMTEKLLIVPERAKPAVGQRLDGTPGIFGNVRLIGI